MRGIHRHATHAVILQGEHAARGVQEGRAGVGEVHEERDGGAEDVRVQKTDAKTHRGGRAREVDRGGGLADAPFPGGHGDDARHTGEALGDGGLLETARGRGRSRPPHGGEPATRQHTKPSAHRRRAGRGRAGACRCEAQLEKPARPVTAESLEVRARASHLTPALAAEPASSRGLIYGISFMYRASLRGPSHPPILARATCAFRIASVISSPSVSNAVVFAASGYASATASAIASASAHRRSVVARVRASVAASTPTVSLQLASRIARVSLEAHASASASIVRYSNAAASSTATLAHDPSPRRVGRGNTPE